MNIIRAFNVVEYLLKPMADCICTKLFGGVDNTHIAIAALAQVAWASLWYSYICSSLRGYYLAADKGVKRLEHVPRRFDSWVCTVATFAAAVVRAFAIVAFVNLLRLTTLSEYVQAATLVTMVVLIATHHAFWAQRPLCLLVINALYEAKAAIFAAVVLHALVGVKVF